MMKLIKNKRGTLLGLMLTIVLFFMIFSGMFLFFQSEMTKPGIDKNIDAKYYALYSNLNQTNTELKGDADKIKNQLTNISSTETGIGTDLILSASAFGNSLNLIFGVLTRATGSFSFITNAIDIIPGWFIVSITTIILILVVVWVLKAVGGRTEI